MASWTDLIPQFNPYVQQLPVEAMVQVGMEKQKRYDEGIQKIQSQIDSVAGLDIARDVDKSYLQSKLDSLGGKLKLMAAGDFSNFQLVNSVSGMTNQIVKDPYVTTAVAATRAYRRGVEDMTTLNKEGKGAPSNDWDFKTKANKWLTNRDLGVGFNETYNPYTNYRKNALEVIKTLTKDSSITDDAFTFDEKGNLVITDAIVRTKLEGIPPERIQQALVSGLNPADWKQIEIDGRYNYSNTDAASFSNTIQQSYTNKRDAYSEQRTVLENAKSSTKSAVEKADLDKKIASIDKVLKNIESEHTGIMDRINSGDIESAKARLYTSDFVNGFSKAFAFTETSRTYENSPLAQMAMEREKQNKDWKKWSLDYQQKDRHFYDQLEVEKGKLSASIRANELKEKEIFGYGGFPSPVDPKDVPAVSLAKITAQTNELNNSVKSADESFLQSQGKDANWLDQQKEAWMKSPNAVDPIVAQHFNTTEGMRRVATENQTMVNQITSEADRKFGTLQDLIPKNSPNILYNDGKGTSYTFTPKDFVDFNSIRENYITLKQTPVRPGSDTGGRLVFTYNDAKAKAELSPKELVLYESMKKEYGLTGEVGKTGAKKVLNDNINLYYDRVNKPYEQVVKQKVDWTGNEVKRRVTGMQGVGYSIPTNTDVQRQSLAGVYVQVANLATSQKGAIAESPGFSAATLKKIAEGTGVQGTMKVVEGTEYAPAMYEVTAFSSNGSTTFRMTPEQKERAFGNRFEPSLAVQAFRPYQTMMRKFSSENSPYWSTNSNKQPVTFANSSLNSVDFPNVKSYGVTGAITSNDAGKSYSLRLNFYDPVNKIYHNDIPYPRLLSEEEVVPIMQRMTDAAAFELLNDGKIATKRDLQLIQNSSKKPL